MLKKHSVALAMCEYGNGAKSFILYAAIQGFFCMRLCKTGASNKLRLGKFLFCKYVCTLIILGFYIRLFSKEAVET